MENIATGVDRLLMIVDEHQEISRNKVCNILKVPRHIIEMWADTLEDANLISSRFTLRERYLVSNNGHKKEGILNSVIQNVKSLTANTTTEEEQKLKNMIKEIKRRENALQKKAKVLRNYQKENAKLEKRKEQIMMHESKISEAWKELKIARSEFNRQVNEISNVIVKIEARDRKLEKTKAELKNYEYSLNEKKEKLLKKQNELSRFEHSLRHEKNRIFSSLRNLKKSSEFLA